MKILHKRYRKDLIILLVMAVVAILYFTGTPRDLIINLLMVGLLISAISYAIIYPLIDTFKDMRSVIEFKRIVKLKQSSEQIDTMTWQEFEIYVAKWLENKGYKNVTITEYYDLGVDIIAEKGGLKWGVQVKHYTNMVKIDAIRQVVVALRHYQCDRAMIVTNSFFSRSAKRLAASSDCVLVEREQLRKSQLML